MLHPELYDWSLLLLMSGGTAAFVALICGIIILFAYSGKPEERKRIIKQSSLVVGGFFVFMFVVGMVFFEIDARQAERTFSQLDEEFKEKAVAGQSYNNLLWT